MDNRTRLIRGFASLFVLFILTSEFLLRQEEEYHIEQQPLTHKLITTIFSGDDDHKHIPTIDNIGAGL